MPGNFKKEDLRIIKTQRSLANALPKLLERRHFTQITVNDICEEAQVSRTAFYLHFNDKYDLLKHLLIKSKSMFIFKKYTYEDYEKFINEQVNNNAKIIINLAENANIETLELLCDYMFSLLDININNEGNGQMSPKDIVFSQFCSGGMMTYFSWQVKNKFPEYLPMMNTYYYGILLNSLKWKTSQE